MRWLGRYTTQTHVRLRTVPGVGLEHFLSIFVGDQNDTGVDIFSYPVRVDALIPSTYGCLNSID